MPDFCLRDLDIAYISYDEPKAEEFYDRLAACWPRPVHWVRGVKGFDRAHKQAASLSTTRRFITVDGDNITTDGLADMVLADAGADVVYSFRARNMVNGLEYGNGGVKVWPRNLVLQVDTHEHAADPKAATDFCWLYRYMQVDRLGSYVHCNQTPQQAFRSGYREGVKMSLVGGQRLADWNTTQATMAAANLSRLMVWMNVGADAENGAWAIYGARRGFFDLWCDGLDHHKISDYDWFRDEVWPLATTEDPLTASQALGYALNYRLGLELPNLTAPTSRWFKSVYLNPVRSGLMIPDMPPVVFNEN